MNTDNINQLINELLKNSEGLVGAAFQDDLLYLKIHDPSITVGELKALIKEVPGFLSDHPEFVEHLDTKDDKDLVF